jgi:GTPase SAR1 family protein
LLHQQEIFDTLRVHCQQGGLCVIVGDPGTGKSVIKQALVQHDPKRLITPVVNRTLHTYASVLRTYVTRFRSTPTAVRSAAQLHLPPLDATNALTLVAIFERAIAAIWRAHGERIALLQLQDTAGRDRDPEYVDDGDPDAPEDTPF